MAKKRKMAKLVRELECCPCGDNGHQRGECPIMQREITERVQREITERVLASVGDGDV